MAGQRLIVMALILLGLLGCGKSISPAGPVPDNQGQPRFTKAEDGVITDRLTGLQWYIAPNQDSTWHEAKAWTEHLTVAGGGWRLPSLSELKALYQPGAAPNNMDPLFQTASVWVWTGDLHNSWSVWGFAFYNGLEGWHSMDYGYGRLAIAVRSRK